MNEHPTLYGYIVIMVSIAAYVQPPPSIAQYHKNFQTTPSIRLRDKLLPYAKYRASSFNTDSLSILIAQQSSGQDVDRLNLAAVSGK